MQHNNSKGQLTAQINMGDLPKTGFNLSHPFRGTGRIGRIYNIRSKHVVPSDKVKGNINTALQFEPLSVPILANMHVKQENFYVPENILWKNFDKFISAGEDMSYQGKKPSMSLKEMFTNWCSMVSNQEDILPVTVTLNKYNSSLNIDRNTIEEMLNFSLPERFKVELDNLQMLDLCDYMVDVMHHLGVILRDISNAAGDDVDTDNNGEIKLFVRGYGEDNILESGKKTVWSANNPNKYLAKMYKSVIAAYDNASTDGVEYLIPTDAGMIFLSYMYEIIKPFFGYSSYLDQMSYNKLTFDNFVYVSVLSFLQYGDIWTNSATNLNYKFANIFPYLSDVAADILPLRAQYCVWWNNYRDQLLEAKAAEPYDGDDVNTKEIFVLLAPRVRCWHKDQFTTALDNPGTGNVGVPINGIYFEANKEGNNLKTYQDLRSFYPYSINSLQPLTDDVYRDASIGQNITEVSIGDSTWKLPTPYLRGLTSEFDTTDQFYTSGFSLYALDAAKRAQKWLQKSLFYGNRIQDFLWTRFGVQYLDARLRLPELLSTSSTLVRLTDVINNTNVASENGTIAVAGDRAAIAHSNDENSYIDRWCEEHGIIITNLTVMPDVTYANGFSRELAMLDQFDYPFPDFASLGMDAVYDVELAQKPVLTFSHNETPDGSAAPYVFGYQGRYYGFKTYLGEEHGELLDSQDMYTFARDFNIYDPDGLPKLNYIFVHCHPTLDMFVVNNKFSDYFRYDIYFNGDADRPFPAHSLYV